MNAAGDLPFAHNALARQRGIGSRDISIPESALKDEKEAVVDEFYTYGI